MVEPVRLAPTKSVSREAKEDAVRILTEALEKAEAGEIETLVIIMQKPNGYWAHESSRTVNFCEMIGRLEVAKQEYIRSYLDQ